MPPQLLRNRARSDEDWQYAETAAAAAGSGGLIIAFEDFQSDRQRWLLHPGRLGVILKPEHQVEALAPDLARFALIAARFPGGRRRERRPSRIAASRRPG